MSQSWEPCKQTAPILCLEHKSPTSFSLMTMAVQMAGAGQPCQLVCATPYSAAAGHKATSYITWTLWAQGTLQQPERIDKTSVVCCAQQPEHSAHALLRQHWISCAAASSKQTSGFARNMLVISPRVIQGICPCSTSKHGHAVD